MSVPKISIPADKVVIVTENHGGYLGGKCLACGASGWLDNKYGWPFGTHDKPGFKHHRTCPMNDVLDSKGEFRK
jgi:hypothetical protein